MADKAQFNAGCATSHPVAVQAGLDMLRSGGNAVDAAVAMAVTLTVVEPTGNGIGGDAFAMIWESGAQEPVGLNASGRSPGRFTAEAIRRAGHETAVPQFGWLPVTVPGAPAAWVDLSRRFGKLPLESLFEPAIQAAREGVPVEPGVARFWARGTQAYSALEGSVFDPWRETFLVEGQAPRVGTRVRLPDHAETLARIAESNGESFYRGAIARAIHAFSRETGGLLRFEDLAAHTNEWVQPLSAGYRDAELWELPPNGQGLAALMAAALLAELPAPTGPRDLVGVHRGIEAIKLAFADVHSHVADPNLMVCSPLEFLDPAYLDRRRVLIGSRAGLAAAGFPQKGGTVYLAAVDDSGLMVSYIQSNYIGFGSGVVVPGTGIALQNRGAGFVLDPSHPRAAGPGRRSFHTIIPGFLSRGGNPWGPMGVMGGHMQPQGHLQVLQALVDFGFTPQEALNMPRWHWERDLAVRLEETPLWDAAFKEGLENRGHEVTVDPDPRLFGRGQVILKNPDGTYSGGSDPRADGCVGFL